MIMKNRNIDHIHKTQRDPDLDIDTNILNPKGVTVRWYLHVIRNS